MIIAIENLKFQAIIGILDFERLTPQNISIDCSITYTFEKTVFINYAEVALHIENSMKINKFELIEDALLSLKATLKSDFPTINLLTLKISKPDILANCEVSLQETFKF